MSGLEGLEFEIRQGYQAILLTETHRLILHFTSANIQLVPGYFLGKKAAGEVYLTGNCHIVSRIRTIHLLIPYAFLAWTGTPLPLPLKNAVNLNSFLNGHVCYPFFPATLLWSRGCDGHNARSVTCINSI
jgi:hypothetical protein